MNTFEIHITIEGEHDGLMGYADAYGLKYSCIDGWDELGEGSRIFLTYHRDELRDVIDELETHVVRLGNMGVKVVRGKIEQCLYDWRPG